MGRKLRDVELKKIRKSPHRARWIVTGAARSGFPVTSSGEKGVRTVFPNKRDRSGRRRSTGAGEDQPSRWSVISSAPG